MDFPPGAFERTGREVEADAAARFECGVCWLVYDPAEGDAVAQIPAGTAFVDLPDSWVCPGCEAAKRRFLLIERD